MNVQDAYGRWSSTYDADPNRTRDLDALVTRKLLDGGHYGSILEIGCGTGKNTEFLAQICDDLRALDVSTEMIERARQKVTSAHVTFVLADLIAPWPCEDAEADLICCNLVLEHIQDLRPVFAEASRTLAPSGRLFISELHPFRQYQGTKATFRRGQETVEITAYVHHVSDFLVTAERAGFALLGLNEWWHDEDAGKPPRLITLTFRKEQLTWHSTVPL
jgi:ubiquinone/menaquinone biosynthesis C-methylase UbiE